ncbi:MAG: S49 family peptidase [Thermoguttaceae bacterium]
MRRVVGPICLALLVCAGCKQPVQVVTEGHVITHSSPVEDRGPLAQMPVIADRQQQSGKIALIDVDGLILDAPLAGMGSMGENPVAVFRERLDCAAADPCCRAVIVRINSPGGGVTASDIMWRDLRTFKARTGLPVVACLMDVATGGGYYLATAADHIVAHPTTITGGMGVILNLYNLQDTLMQYNIAGAQVKAGAHVDLGTPLEPMDKDARQILQHIADQFHERFRNVVRMTRPEHDPGRAEDFDGRIWPAAAALQRKLIDSIGYVDDAADIARRLGNAPGACVVMFHRCNDPARSPYAVSPNSPMQTGMLPLSLPGLERTQLPAFLYIWQPEPTLEHRAGGR